MGHALDRAEGAVERGPERVLPDQRRDLVGQCFRLGGEEGDRLSEAVQREGILCGMQALLVDLDVAPSPVATG
jgi:hypothetical protein